MKKSRSEASIDDPASGAAPDLAPGTGVRNYQARNFACDDMRASRRRRAVYSPERPRWHRRPRQASRLSGRDCLDPASPRLRPEVHAGRAALVARRRDAAREDALAELQELRALTSGTRRDAQPKRGKLVSITPVAPAGVVPCERSRYAKQKVSRMKIAIIGAGAIGGYWPSSRWPARTSVSSSAARTRGHRPRRHEARDARRHRNTARATSSPPTTTAAGAVDIRPCWPPRPIRWRASRRAAPDRPRHRDRDDAERHPLSGGPPRSTAALAGTRRSAGRSERV